MRRRVLKEDKDEEMRRGVHLARVKREYVSELMFVVEEESGKRNNKG